MFDKLPLTKLLMTLLLSSSGFSTTGEVHDRVDMIELNHYTGPLSGENGYSQLIFWEWSPDYRRYIAMQWRLVDPGCQRPVRSGEWYVVRFEDKDARALRVVRTRHFIETWGTVDPERADKRLTDEKYRVRLRRKPIDPTE